jgi:hypothetical protein
MPAAKKSAKGKKLKKTKQSSETRFDLIFSGPLLFVPETTHGDVTGLEVFAPQNGHHMGAVFLPGVIFTNAELDDPKSKRWPGPDSFSLLDPHSYLVELTQSSLDTAAPFPVASIPATNHKIKPGRRLSADWDVAVTVRGRIAEWTSHRSVQVTEGLFHGADAPALGSTISSLHRLSYAGVTAADLHGALSEPRAYLRENTPKGGTLIIIGEIPYQSTLLHERKAIDAIAKLAGLDLHLAEMTPKPFQDKLMGHLIVCGASLIMV